MKAHNLALLSSIKNADYISTDGITVFAATKKEGMNMDAHAVEVYMIKSGVPQYWDFITTYDDVIKAWYFDFENGEDECDIFMIDDWKIYRKLKGMPYDKNGRHATGWELWKQTTFGGLWEVQYEEEEEDDE